MNKECCNHNCNQGRDCPLRNKEINNEPVAWADKAEGILSFDYMGAGFIPLYTHPAKETLDTRSYLMGRYDTSPVKELTDEEIRAIHEQTDGNLNMINFARAILRKSQEK